jgi:hypothetical protein
MPYLLPSASLVLTVSYPPRPLFAVKEDISIVAEKAGLLCRTASRYFRKATVRLRVAIFVVLRLMQHANDLLETPRRKHHNT